MKTSGSPSCASTAAAVGLALVLPLLPLRLHAAEYHVDNVKGDDASSGSRARPFKTIGKMLQVVRGGDTVHLVPNAEPYTESFVIRGQHVSGTPRRPTVFDGHGATLSHLVRYTAGKMRDEGGGVYSAKLGNNAWVMDAQGYWSGFPIVFIDGKPLEFVRKRDELRENTYLLYKQAKKQGEKDYSPLHNTLYVKLPAGKTPDDVVIEAPSEGENVVVDGPSHVVIRNLTSMYSAQDGFDTVWGKGIVLENVRGCRNMDQGISNHSAQAVVRNSRFDGNAGCGIVDINMNPNSPCRVRYENCVVENDVFRGGVEFHSGEFEMVNCIVRNNPGKAIEVTKGARVKLENCLFFGGEKEARGPWVTDGSTLEMTNCTVVSLRAGFYVGVWNRTTTATVTNCAFIRCDPLYHWDRPRQGARAALTSDFNYIDPAPVSGAGATYVPGDREAFVSRTGLDGNSIVKRYAGPVPPAALPQFRGKGRNGGDIGACITEAVIVTRGRSR